MEAHHCRGNKERLIQHSVERKVKWGLACYTYGHSASRIKSVKSNLGLPHAIRPSPTSEANDSLQML